MSGALPLFRPVGSGISRCVLGMHHSDRLVPADTAGAFLLLELSVPAGCSAPLHSHAHDAEAFYMLEGCLTFSGPDGHRTLGPGDVCYLPATGEHAFRNDGPEPAKALVMVAPGVAAEAFFRRIDGLAAAGPVTPDVVAATAADYELTLS